MELKCEQYKMDEREEGELSDELEDISDGSSLESFNTLLSSYFDREPFKELSVTSVSDDSSDSSVKITNYQPPRVPKRSVRRHCKKDYPPVKLRKTRKYERRDFSSVSSSSDSDEYISDKRVLRQLRDAVRINSTKKNPNCSLRTRLKRMIEPDSPPSSKNSDHSDQELENLRDQALKSKNVNSEEMKIDEDLNNLRLIALQSAVLKKHEKRKKRKLLQDNNETSKGGKNEVEPKTDLEEEINYVVDNLIDSVNNNKDDVGTDKVENKIEEKPDAAGAESKSNEIEPTAPTEDDEDILRAMLLTSISRKISRKTAPIAIASKNVAKPLVKTIPLQKKIIKSIPSKPLPIAKTNPTNNVPVKRLVINVNTDSDSEENESSKKPPAKGDTKRFEQKLSSFLKEARKKSEQQSDISKHLPRSQQIEYRHLQKKLQQLSKLRMHARLMKNEPDENKRIVSKKSSRTKFINPNQQTNGRNINNVDRWTNPLVFLSSFSGNAFFICRLNVKGKYEGLAPLMLKVSQAKTARDKAQSEVKRLINELRNARIKLTSTHQAYTTLVQKLLHEKAELERLVKCDKMRNIRNVNVSIAMYLLLKNLLCSQNKLPCSEPVVQGEDKICTSTPYKNKPEVAACEISQIPSETVEDTDGPLSTKLNDTKEDLRTKVVCKEGEKVGFSKYNSPLDHIQQPGFV